MSGGAAGVGAEKALTVIRRDGGGGVRLGLRLKVVAFWWWWWWMNDEDLREDGVRKDKVAIGSSGEWKVGVFFSFN